MTIICIIIPPDRSIWPLYWSVLRRLGRWIIMHATLLPVGHCLRSALITSFRRVDTSLLPTRAFVATRLSFIAFDLPFPTCQASFTVIYRNLSRMEQCLTYP